MALYGRSFTLNSAAHYNVGDPASRAGQAGHFTREAGFLAYYEVREKVVMSFPSATSPVFARSRCAYVLCLAQFCACVCVCVCVCPSVAHNISERSEAIAIKFDPVTASVTRTHHMLIILTLTFIQGHTDVNHEMCSSKLLRSKTSKCVINNESRFYLW